MIVADDVIERLTGRKQPKRQIAWLVERGWKFEVGADGRPKVSQAYFDGRMNVPQPKRKGPRLAGLHGAT